MCELLGMNCNTPTDICFSFTGFCERGGNTAEHADGWGITFFEGKATRTFIEQKSSVDSPIAEFVKTYPIKSLNVIAHVRQAKIGAVELQNNQPFKRELWGQNWIFAHNGDLLDYEPKLRGRFTPIGETDSELAFCQILEFIDETFPNGIKSPEDLRKPLYELAMEIKKFGIFNFILSNGEFMIVFCSTKLQYIIRQHPFHEAHLCDKDVTIDFSNHTTIKDKIAIISTVPLTDDEPWMKLQENDMLIFKNGEIL